MIRHVGGYLHAGTSVDEPRLAHAIARAADPASPTASARDY